MSLRRAYQSAVVEAATQHHEPAAALPLILVQACLSVLPVAGAGISITAELRLPLAATSVAVAEAERLQTTLGEGPCLDAVTSGRPVAVALEAMADRWPVYAAELLAATPFRSVASLPLELDGTRLGAVDLYSLDPDAPFGDLTEVIDAVIDPMGAVLVGEAEWVPQLLQGFGEPTQAAARRLDVWTAVGMVVHSLALTADDALAVLRGYAFSRALSLETVAERLIERRLEPEALADAS